MFQALRTFAVLVLIAFALAVPETDQVVPEATESFFESMSKDVKAAQLADAPSLLQAADSPSTLLQAPAPAPVHSEDVKAVELVSSGDYWRRRSPGGGNFRRRQGGRRRRRRRRRGGR